MIERRMSLGRTFVYAFSYLLLLVWLTPLVWMALTALKPAGTAIENFLVLLRGPYTLENFEFVLGSSSLYRWLFNSILISSVTTAGTLVMTSLAAYALSALDFDGKRWLYWVIIGGMMVPMEATIVSLYLLMNDLNLLGGYWCLILPGWTMPLGVVMLKQFFDAIPRDLVNAARMDGAGKWRIYWNVFMPLSRSSMAALAIFTFLSSWNNFLWPYLAVLDEKMLTMPIGIPLFQSTYTTEIARPMAANFLASLPVLVAFILFQRHIIKGVSMTGIK